MSLTGCATNWRPDVQGPNIPDKQFNITEFGAVPDGKTLNTASIQKAIDACAKAGGGLVVVPEGKFLTSAFHLKSNVNLNLQAGAVLFFSDKRDDYASPNSRYENFITADNCHDIGITGPANGTAVIDGNGTTWWEEFLAKRNTMPHRPFLIVLGKCQRVKVANLTLRDSPMEHLVPRACQDVSITDLKILDHDVKKAKNADGIDPSGKNILIARCTIDSGDDNIAVKATDRYDPAQPSVENLLIENCTFLHGHGCSIGGQSYGGMRKMVVRDCTFQDTDAGIRTKAPRTAGGLVEDLTYENLTMKNVQYAISLDSYYPEHDAPKDLSTATSRPITRNTPIWRNMHISHVTATGGEFAGRIIGIPEMPISDIVFDDVHISAQKPLTIAEAKNISFSNSQIQVDSGHPLQLVNAQITGIDPKTGK